MRAARTSSSASPSRESGKHAKRPREQDADRRLRMLAEIIGPLTQSLGANYEIVLHDYRIPDRSVVAVAGKVTARRVGSAMSEIGLSILAEGDKAQDRLNYLARRAMIENIRTHPYTRAVCLETARLFEQHAAKHLVEAQDRADQGAGDSALEFQTKARLAQQRANAWHLRAKSASN